MAVHFGEDVGGGWGSFGGKGEGGEETGEEEEREFHGQGLRSRIWVGVNRAFGFRSIGEGRRPAEKWGQKKRERIFAGSETSRRETWKFRDFRCEKEKGDGWGVVAWVGQKLG
ncbi:hypothetical protein LBMAG56_35480 [Verrucomicrobiota bacterium]|nr:hypothetical protein LBMAG56_35480 [Verrucomicrobiota bacterium]